MRLELELVGYRFGIGVGRIRQPTVLLGGATVEVGSTEWYRALESIRNRERAVSAVETAAQRETRLLEAKVAELQRAAELMQVDLVAMASDLARAREALNEHERLSTLPRAHDLIGN